VPVVAVLSALSTGHIGIHAIFGAFLLDAIIPLAASDWLASAR
jgi:Kef-type K+ transport system membrane component KefB